MSHSGPRWSLFGVAALALAAAGCDAMQAPSPPRQSAAPAAAASQSTRAEGRKQFAAFVLEAEKAVALLESHPSREALRDASTRLHDLLTRAGDADSSDAMDELVEEGRTALRYFDAGLKVANFQARRKDVTPEAAKRFIDKTCDGNAPAFRQLIGMLKTKFEKTGGG